MAHSTPRGKVGVFGIGLATYWPQFEHRHRRMARQLLGLRLETGNTNSRLKFALDPADFMNRWSEQGPTHHSALGIGHQVSKIRKLARLLGVDLIVVG